MDNENIPLGSKIWVDRPGYSHYGVLLSPGWVAHSSKESGKGCFVSFRKFSDGRKVHFTPPPPGAQLNELLKRVRSALGKPYSLLNFNCEHFANWAQTGTLESRQVNFGLGAAGIAAFLAITRDSNLPRSLWLILFAAVLGIAVANIHGGNQPPYRRIAEPRF